MTVRLALGSALWFAMAPGVIGGVVPWLITGWGAAPAPATLRIAGVGLLLPGVAVLLGAFVRFVREGRGTPAPPAPPGRLVTGGAYRWVRNPMYLAVGAVIAGQSALLARPELLPYLAAFAIAACAFVLLYEEPALERRFGPSYEEYLRAVPRWLPRPPA